MSIETINNILLSSDVVVRKKESESIMKFYEAHSSDDSSKEKAITSVVFRTGREIEMASWLKSIENYNSLKSDTQEFLANNPDCDTVFELHSNLAKCSEIFNICAQHGAIKNSTLASVSAEEGAKCLVMVEIQMVEESLEAYYNM